MNKLTLLLVGLVVAYASAQCTKLTIVTSEGGACGGTTGASCLTELSCIGATSTTSGTCKFQLQVGDACTTDSDCVNSYYNQFCNANKCAIRYKNAGASCSVNGECAGNSCVSGSCAAQVAGSSCATNSLCGSPTNLLFCNLGVCNATAAAGAACGTNNGLYTQCVPGYYCVGSGSTGTCQAGVTEGATCAAAATTLTNIWANPGCSNANSQLNCLSSKCVAPSATIAIGQPCGTTDIANSGKSCNPRESFCSSSGTCVAYSSLSCNSVLNCGGGVCNCQSDLTKNGTCAVNPYLTTSCSASQSRASDCGSTLNTQDRLNTCGDKYKAYRCCLRNLNLVPNKDLTLAYCSSATFAQVSVVVVAVVAMFALFF